MQHWITPHTSQEQDAFTAGMIAADEYREGRDALAKRIAPALPVPEVSSVEKFDKTVKALTMPVLRLTGLLAVVGVIGGTAVAGVSAVFAVVAANALPVAGGIVAVTVAVLALAGANGGGEQKTSNQDAPPGDDGKWEYYQEQRQGWRKI